MSRTSAVLVGAILLALVAGTAHPWAAPDPGAQASVRRLGAKLVYTAAIGVANEIRAEQLPGAIRLSDEHPIRPLDAACVAISNTTRHSVICDARGVIRLEIWLRDEADSAVATGFTTPVDFIGGTGDDRLIGSDADDRFIADASSDGADVVDGGSGSDTVDYSARTGGVEVTLDDLPNDGVRVGRVEGDNVRVTVENVVGTRAADVLAASATLIAGFASPQTLIGNGGDDRIVGGSGDDTIFGGEGKDRIDGGAGNDVIDAGADDDVSVNGGDGADVLTGGEGDDQIRGGDGADIVRGGLGNDEVRGGAGPEDFCDGEGGVDLEDQSDCETG